MWDVMLDLETMGQGPDAAIVAIGAVEFDIASRQTGEKFYSIIDLESSVEDGGVIDAQTVMWWMKQSDEARSAFSRPSESLRSSLLQFSAWLATRARRDEIKIWGNGAAFDNVVLASAYKRAGIATPWVFWNDRCYRTVKSMFPNCKMKRSGTHHNAVDDAESQALHLIEMLSPF